MPLFTSGQKVRASTLQILVPIRAEKAAALSRFDNTRAADPDLIVALPANTKWDFEFGLWLLGGNAAGDFSCDFTFPTGGVMSVGAAALVDTIASGGSGDIQTGALNNVTVSPAATFNVGVSASIVLAYFRGRLAVGSIAGNLGINWAQENTNATATQVLAQSYVVARYAP